MTKDQEQYLYELNGIREASRILVKLAYGTLIPTEKPLILMEAAGYLQAYCDLEEKKLNLK